MLSTEEVKKVAQLARLNLSEEELELYRGQLSSILDYVGQLKEVNTDGVEPTSQVTGLANVTREDIVEKASVDEHERIISQFPAKRKWIFESTGSVHLSH